MKDPPNLLLKGDVEPMLAQSIQELRAEVERLRTKIKDYEALLKWLLTWGGLTPDANIRIRDVFELMSRQ